MATNPTLKNLRIGHLEYNGFVFPALSDITASVKAVYDDAGNSVKYYEAEFDVSFIYYPTAEDHVVSNLDSTKSYKDTAYLPTYMSILANDLKNRLLQPAQPFAMNGMGFGDFTYNTVGQPIGNGLTPIECTWAPIAGDIIAQFSWKASFKFTPGCSSSLNSSGITSLNYSVGWEQSEDDSFQFTRNISGTVEFRNYRTNLSILTARPKASTNLQSLNTAIRDKLYPILAQLFPKPAGYKRTRRLSLAEDNRTLSFSYTDVEIMKDVAPPRPILNLQMKNPIQSDIGQGFQVWKVGFSGEVTVAKARNRATTSFSSQKKLAWVAIGRMISQRLQSADKYTYFKVTEGSPIGSIKTAQSKILLDSIQIEDNVNEPGFSFSIQYRVFIDQKQIYKATGMFDTVGIPGETWERREQYLQSIGAEQDAITPWPQDRPPVFDSCNNPVIAPPYESNDNKTETSTNITESAKKIPEENRTLWFDNNYEIEELNQSSIHVPLNNSQEARTERLRSDIPNGIVPVSDGYSGGAANPIVTNPTAKTFIVTMSGFTLTVGAPWTPPNLVKYGGKDCIKIGNDKTKVRQKVVGVVLDTLQTSTAIYRTAWMKKYLVYGQLSPNTVAYRDMDSLG